MHDATGIQADYKDSAGRIHPTSDQTRAALCRAMGLEPGDPVVPASPTVHVLGPDQAMSLDRPAELRLEDGTTLSVEEQIPPDLPWGYHELLPAEAERPSTILKSPGRCHPVPDARSWGWAIQLYAVRSLQSWGMGDLADLRRLGQWASKLGADAVLLNPVGAVAPVLPQQASPYYPSSRRFRNPLYLRIEEIPGAGEMAPDLDRLAARARRLNRDRRIDRDEVFRLKMAALEKLWDRWSDDPGFERFVDEGGDDLRLFAAYCVLAERYDGDWRKWPAEYRRPNAPAVRQCMQAHAGRVRFHAWLQWLLDEQLARAACETSLVLDLPIGVDPGGADAWQWQDVLATGATVGAPPDEFNANGQDWRLPPWVPHRLRAARYEPMIQTIRASLRHAGGLRIDHVMGLFRLFWIPQGLGPRHGAYVRYPADELLAIVAIESHRAGAWIAGEDLGTVEAGVRRRLARCAMLSYRLLWFEDCLPSQYPAATLASIATHDLPTVAGLWSGADFEAQRRIGLSPDADAFARIRQRLVRATDLEDDASVDEAIRRAYRALGQAPSAMLAASLDDALAVAERPNMPGTRDRWPNWSLALPAGLEAIESSELARIIAASLDAR